jgi:predicted HicB family RNase H-like nuclease
MRFSRVLHHVSHLVGDNIAGTIGRVPLKVFVCEVAQVSKEISRPISFPLRLPFTTRRQAIEIAQREGLSLNQFISLAVAEKITRLEHTSWPEQMNGSSTQPLMARKTG